VIVTAGKFVVPPTLMIATGVSDVTGAVNRIDVVSDDEVDDVVEALPPMFPELIASVIGTRLPVT
jgi:hypothetical protein